MNFEILAPAGSMESLIAGVRSGANAVYLGGKLFNARRNAGNFNDDELYKAVVYCHQRGVKVYLALNILLSDNEFEDAYKLAEKALSFGVDAFIIQDIGVAKMIKEHFEQAKIHASTQMSIMTPRGVKAAEEMGFSRVVLPRELSLEEIRQIRRSSDIELELFVHGALCMSVSGQCYLSSMLGARSGNRGLCAQPCRLPFSPDNKQRFALSLKDMSIIKKIAELDGITSLKIEGRMKRPEYVSAAVTALKKAIDGTYGEKDEKLLRGVFSRSGFTDGYINGDLGRDMFGTRRKDDVISAANVLKELRHKYDKENPLLPLKLHFVCKENRPCTLTAEGLGKTATVSGDIPEKAVNRPMRKQELVQRLSKLGGTQFYPDRVTVELDDGLILPVSKINDMRRSAVEKITQIENKPIISKPFKAEKTVKKNKIPYLTASFKNADQVPDKHPFSRIFLPLDSAVEDFSAKNAGAAIPRGAFGMEEKLKKRLCELKNAGITKILCPDIGSYALAKEMGFDVYGDFGLNIFNSKSARLIKSPVLSFELTLEQANRINADDTGIIVYGRVPLMLARNCPVKNITSCNKCKKHGVLKDRMGYEFPVICSPYPCTEILNSVPIYMLDRVNEIKTDFIHFFFSTETKQEIENIIRLYENRKKPDFKYTRGLYNRGVI